MLTVDKIMFDTGGILHFFFLFLDFIYTYILIDLVLHLLALYSFCSCKFPIARSRNQELLVYCYKVAPLDDLREMQPQ